MSDPVIVMEHLVTLTYREELPPNLLRFGRGLMAGRIIGQRCPSCLRVFVPGKGYCPLDVVVMDVADEVEVSDHGTVTGFTIVAPVRYYGQTRTEPFVYASVLLDGASGAMSGQDIAGIPADQVRAGMRVKANWKPAGQRSLEGQSPRGWGSLIGAIDGFTPSGEPEVSKERYREHLF